MEPTTSALSTASAMITAVGRSPPVRMYSRSVEHVISGYFGLPKALEDWLGDAWEFKRDIPTLRITLGPNGSYFAIDKDGYAWDNLPESLEEDVATCCDPEEADDPRLVALGAGGGFLMITRKGLYTYDFTGFSQKLDEAFDGSTSEVGNLDDIRVRRHQNA